MSDDGPVYCIGTYDVDDPAELAKYPPIVASLLPGYGAVVLASDAAARAVEGPAIVAP